MSGQHPDQATLVEVAGGSASAALSEAVQGHAADCAACRRRLDGLKVALGVAQQSPTPASSGEQAQARAKLEAALVQQTRPIWNRDGGGLKIAAGLAVVVMSGSALAFGIGAAKRAWFDRPAPPPAVATSQAETTVAEPVEEKSALEIEVIPAVAPSAPPVLDVAPPKSPALVTPSKEARRAKAKDKVRAVVPPSAAVVPEAVDAVPHRKVAIAAGAKTALEVATEVEREAKRGPVGNRQWLTVGDLFAQAGEAERAGGAYLNALKGPGAKTARQRLAQVAAADPSAARQLLTQMRSQQAAGSAAEELRLRCEWGLRFNADRPAVLDCRAFGQQHPEHPAMRTLALAAGETAERRLSDCQLAIGEYSRALLLGKSSGMATAGALAARARCRQKVGDDEEARADLKLYLVMRPAGAYDDAIRALARRLEASDLIDAAVSTSSP